TTAIARAHAAAEAVNATAPTAGTYLLPLATRCRALFKMDLAEAGYIAELRTGPGGHFSYRWAAWELAEAVRAKHPILGRHIRATDPRVPIDLLHR
ncbi:MAG: FAD-dependent thymidylate synthase, partial [Dehalococcoidia bacterium]|nr:FAD-dependent thymidylate synthase [Dehalococcoidia bacterium]